MNEANNKLTELGEVQLKQAQEKARFNETMGAYPVGGSLINPDFYRAEASPEKLSYDFLQEMLKTSAYAGYRAWEKPADRELNSYDLLRIKVQSYLMRELNKLATA